MDLSHALKLNYTIYWTPVFWLLDSLRSGCMSAATEKQQVRVALSLSLAKRISCEVCSEWHQDLGENSNAYVALC